MLLLGVLICRVFLFFFFKQKTAYEMRISDWSSDVCSSDLKVATPETLQDAYLAAQEAMADQVFPDLGLVALKEYTAFRDDVKGVDVPYSMDRRFQIGRASCRESVCQYV